MNISEKIKYKPNEVKLYKEGIFWVAYEQSAFAICQIKKYNPNKKFIKTVNCEVVSIGFPDNALESVLTFFENIDRQINIITMSPKEQIDFDLFEEWKKNIVSEKESKDGILPSIQNAKTYSDTSSHKMRKDDANGSSIEEKIKIFDLANSTPMQCINFISELKNGII